MSRDLRRMAATAAALSAALTACSGDPTARPEPSEAPSVVESPTTDARSPTENETSDAPEPGSMQTPGETSGELSRRDFPRPRGLGAGWAYAVDMGDAEEGYVGNGTPALARNPREIVQTAVPFGCARKASMPLPEHALEVDYRASGTPVIAIRSRFADAATAEQFFTARMGNLRRCLGRGGGAVGPLVTDLRSYGARMVLSGRTQKSDPWMELAVLDGDSVVLLASRNRADQPPLTAQTARRLAARFETS